MSRAAHDVIPGHVSRDNSDGVVNVGRTREPGIHNRRREYGFRACPTDRLRRLAGHPGMTKSEVI